MALCHSKLENSRLRQSCDELCRKDKRITPADLNEVGLKTPGAIRTRTIIGGLETCS